MITRNEKTKQKFVSIALFLLTLLAGGLEAKLVIALGNGGFAPDLNTDGG
jgi:hypothetical protein